MNSDWAAVLITIATALGGAVWAIWKWGREQRAERAQERQRLDSLYVNPLLFAAQDLQSRLFNLLDRGGLGPLRERDPNGGYAIETVHLLARYLAWEQLSLRFTNLGSDASMVRLTQGIREILATDKGGVDPWCLFRPAQAALGQAVIVWRQGEVGFADTMPLTDFQRLMATELSESLRLDDAVQSLLRTSTIRDLDPRSLQRLADVQSALVDLLEHVESTVRTKSKQRFSVADEPRLRCRLAGGHGQARRPSV
jgi:hypothetical protein